MTGLHTALQTFWSQFTYGTAIPAYEQGNVPETVRDPVTGNSIPTPYPYITYEVAQGAYFGATFLTAFVWVKKTGAWDVKRAAILDNIALAIPDEGVTLTLTDGTGAVALYRNDAGFVSYYDDPEDASVAGGRISVEIHYYTT